MKLTQSGLSDTDGDSQSVNRTTLFSLSLLLLFYCAGQRLTPHYRTLEVRPGSHELSLESPIKSLLNVLLQSLTSIPQIHQSIFQTNRLEIASHLVKPPPKRKTVYSEPCHVLRGEKCLDASRRFALKYRVRRDLNTDVSVFD